MARKSDYELANLTILWRGLFMWEALLLLIASASPDFNEFHFTVEPSDVVAIKDSSALLNCSSRYGSDQPGMEWIKDGVYMNIAGDNRIYKLENGSLYFSRVIHSRTDRPDEGIFQCVATINEIGTIVSRKAKLQVAYLSKSFIEEPSDKVVHLGDTTMFACNIEGAPKPTVRWYRDEMELSIDSLDYFVHSDGVLEISNTKFEDLGNYKCKAENVEKARTSSVAILSQESDSSTYQGVPPNFVMKPHDRVVIESTTVYLYCGANGRDREEHLPKISWLKDGVAIDLADLDSRYSIVRTGTLQIEDIKEQDNGIYTCRAENLEDSKDAEARLTVHVPPRFDTSPSNVFAHINADITLECKVHGIPKPTVQWMKNGDVVVPSDYFQVIDGHNLKILGLVNSDEGLYQCVAENEVGNIQASAQLKVLKQDHPLPATNTPPFTSPKTHHSGRSVQDNYDVPPTPSELSAAIVSTRFITLTWSMPSSLAPEEILAFSVFWREHGSDRERVMNTTQREANIQHMKSATRYEFRVVAYNNAGPSRSAAQITVETQQEVHVPMSANNLQAFPVSPTTIRITWEPPLQEDVATSPITNYKLYYYEVNGQKEHFVDVSGLDHSLTSLGTFTQYSFRVVAYNTNGAGMSTEEVVARTYSDVPSEPPQNVTVDISSSSSIIAHWEPPPPEARNGIITGYKIRYKIKERGARGSTATLGGNIRSYDMTDLEKGQTYQIRIQAQTVNGTGPATPWIEAQTMIHDLDELNVPGQPSSLDARATENYITISFTPPRDQNVMIRGYKLGYGIGVPDVYQQILDSKQRYHKIMNLTPLSSYVITLRAFNNMGEGAPTYTEITTREPSTPEPATPMTTPLGLKATVLSSKTILVTWSDSTLGRNQRITDNRYYTVRYNPKMSKKYRMANSTDLNIHINDLKPNTEYEFSVMVVKGRRASTFSLSVFNRTFESAPTTAPRDLTPAAVEGKPKWVMLNWQPPRQANGQITGYLVFFTTDATKMDRDWVVEGVLGDKLTAHIKNLTPETTYYFKVQARNGKGYGPMSPTVIYRTPHSDGTGGGRIEPPNDWGTNRKPTDHTRSGGTYKNKEAEEDADGISPMVLWIIIGNLCGITFIAIVAVTGVVCYRKRKSNEAKRNQSNANKNLKLGTKDLKPPDLWIHGHMEMKNMDKSENSPSAMVPPQPQDHHHKQSMDNLPEEKLYHEAQEDEKYNRVPPMRQKTSLMIPVDAQRQPPRDPIGHAIPNGHLLSDSNSSIPTRPVYPRTQYNTPYTSTPRVNAGDLSQPSSAIITAKSNPNLSSHLSTHHHLPFAEEHQTSTMERRKPRSDRHKKHAANGTHKTGPQSPDSPSYHNQQAPIPYDQLQHQMHSAVDGCKSLHRPGHPLRSFAVPGPPSQSVPNTPTTPKQHIVRPTQQASIQPNQPTSPYKKPPPPVSSTPMKSRSPMPVVTPKAPDVTYKSNQSDTSDIPKSCSAEELTAEMANLEGLMKDLNAITQQEFEC